MTLSQAETDTLSPIAEICMRPPCADDAVAVHDLIGACPPLDANSLYANLLQCTHFADTCALATDDEGVLAWVSGYLPPQQPHTYFLWQVAAHPRARGRGIATRLVRDILARDVCGGVRELATTITLENAESWRLFTRLASRLDAPMRRERWFERGRHFARRHDSEFLVTIGPFERPSAAR
jgi:L-2,4-diaminobutyric acid acetyltransferase